MKRRAYILVICLALSQIAAANPGTTCGASNWITAWFQGKAATCTQPNFTDISGTAALTQGGTGQITAGASFDALSPVTTRGDMITRSATTNQRLALGTVGKIPRSDGTDLVYSTTTWPNSATQGDTLIATGANAFGSRAAVATGQMPISQGVSTAWIWSNTPTLLNGNLQIGVTGGSTIIANQLQIDTNAATGQNLRITVSSANLSGTRVALRKTRGTIGAETATQSGDDLGRLGWWGFGTTVYNTVASAYIQGTATEAHTDTAFGGKLEFWTTPNTTVALVKALTIDQDQSATFAGNIVTTTNSISSTSGAMASTTGAHTSTTGLFSATAGGFHTGTGGTAPTLTAGCNGAGVTAITGTNQHGSFTTQTAAATTCTITWSAAAAWPYSPDCLFYDDAATVVPVAFSTGACGTTTCVVDFVSAAAKKIGYICQ